MRKVDHKRENGSKVGLSKKEAERKLRRMIDATTANARVAEQVTLKVAGDRYVSHLEGYKGRKPTTIGDYRGYLSAHLVPMLGDRAISSITRKDVEQCVRAKLATNDDDRKKRAKAGRLSAKTVNNHLNFLSGLFSYAVKEEWATLNPVSAVDRPSPPRADDDDELRFLTIEEIEAVLRAVPDDEFGATDRVLYLTAAMTGLRQGELVALRWRHVRWTNSTIHVRLNYTRGREGSPKSGKGRPVPMAKRVATELQRHYERSRFQGDDDRVFPHPLTGHYYDASKMRKRLKAAVAAAEVTPITFHELRHTFGTTMAANGKDVTKIKKWMGHASVSTTERYMHYAPHANDADDIGAAFESDPIMESVAA
jgi:integrase